MSDSNYYGVFPEPTRANKADEPMWSEDELRLMESRKYGKSDEKSDEGSTTTEADTSKGETNKDNTPPPPPAPAGPALPKA